MKSWRCGSKTNDFRCDQVQAFYPFAHGHGSGHCYHSGKESLCAKVDHKSDPVSSSRASARSAHKVCFAAIHDSEELGRLCVEDLCRNGRGDLIGNGKIKHLDSDLFSGPG